MPAERNLVGPRLYSALFREFLLATMQSDDSVKVNFRALDPVKQEEITAEVERVSQQLGNEFEVYLKEHGINPLTANAKTLRSIAHAFLRDVSSGATTG